MLTVCQLRSVRVCVRYTTVARENGNRCVSLFYLSVGAVLLLLLLLPHYTGAAATGLGYRPGRHKGRQQAQHIALYKAGARGVVEN